MLARVRSFLRSLSRRGRFEEDMSEEMRFHLEARSADLVRSGLAPEVASRRARIEFGASERYKEEVRTARGVHVVDRLHSDLRFACRSFGKNPMFAAVAILTLAIGIGANALVFSLVNSVLLKPLAYRDADRIYSLRTLVPNFAHVYPDVPVNARHFLEFKKECTSCESMALLTLSPFNLGGAGEPQRVEAISATAELFPMLGIAMQLGRPFTEAEHKPGSDRVIAISDALWRDSFGGDIRAIGRKVMWNETPVEIVAVLPPGFRFPRGDQMGAMHPLPDRVDVFRPLSADLSRMRVGGNFNYAALVKLRPNTSAERAMAEMNRSLVEFSKEAKQEMRAILYPLKVKMTEPVRGPLWLLFGAVTALLLIVCLNLGNLMMARAAGRQRDWSIRHALGARRTDLFRQALAESVSLSLVGGALGTVIAAGGVDLLARLAPATLPRLDEISLDWRVVSFTFVISALAGAVCSLAPVWRLLRAEPQDALRAGSPRATATSSERRLRHALMSFEAGLSMALAAAGGLLIVSFVRVLSVDKGFEAERVHTFQLALSNERYQRLEQRNQFHRVLLDKIRSTPQVTSAGLTTHLPLQGEIWVSQLRRKGEKRHFSELPIANYRFVSDGYFSAIGMKIKSGRGFEEMDQGRNVAVLSERAARVAFPGENAVGHSIEYNDEREPTVLEIVGVAPDVKTKGLDSEPPMIVYLPYWRLAPGSASYVVRASADDPSLITRIRAAVASLDPELPIHRVQTMEQIVDSSVAARRLQTLLAAFFAGAGLLLACFGIFGVVSYGVSLRTSEIGVRLALGATRGNVVGMVVREAMWPVLIGLTGGLMAALAMGRLLASQLYGVHPHDPVVLGVIAAVVGSAALAASYWPAFRASRIEPVQALRWE